MEQHPGKEEDRDSQENYDDGIYPRASVVALEL